MKKIIKKLKKRKPKPHRYENLANSNFQSGPLEFELATFNCVLKNGIGCKSMQEKQQERTELRLELHVLVYQ